jgi:hypothetical protein
MLTMQSRIVVDKTNNFELVSQQNSVEQNPTVPTRTEPYYRKHFGCPCVLVDLLQKWVEIILSFCSHLRHCLRSIQPSISHSRTDFGFADANLQFSGRQIHFSLADNPSLPWSVNANSLVTDVAREPINSGMEAEPAAEMPSPFMTFHKVRQRILKSSHRLQ